ncbi:hypothetical protein SAMN06296386_10684 [Lachnospiraceae bacterium]|nr:hypothetical protein SAMN06296386_10684 [Lachnospiraceae bacterium]
MDYKDVNTLRVPLESVENYLESRERFLSRVVFEYHSRIRCSILLENGYHREVDVDFYHERYSSAWSSEESHETLSQWIREYSGKNFELNMMMSDCEVELSNTDIKITYMYQYPQKVEFGSMNEFNEHWNSMLSFKRFIYY